MLNFQNKPIIAMLHLKADGRMGTLERMKRETELYYHNGVDAVLVENYFGEAHDCEEALAYLREQYPDKCYGINILGDYDAAFRLADHYGADFIQIDSVCGHLKPPSDRAYAQALLAQKRQYPQIQILGGVRFKYQPIYSGRTLAEDLALSKERCAAVVTTGDGTGHATPIEKLREFRALLGDFPLVAGAGVTAKTAAESLRYADGAIIGSYFKEDHDVYGDVCEAYVKGLMQQVYSSRGQLQ